AAPFAARSADLLAAMRDFEVTYASYNEFQRQMERYWCLRWLRQAQVRETGALVLRENTVRLDGMPFVARVPDLPPVLAGARVQLAVGEADLFNVELPLRYLRTLSEAEGAS
ncbi:MAG: RNB domain-containing ribonuclease, partial [Rhodocyclaceae bacterium]|nr:RNB domain-containing ribonuclease [Rhodocyclaceae bacterium]